MCIRDPQSQIMVPPLPGMHPLPGAAGGGATTPLIPDHRAEPLPCCSLPIRTSCSRQPRGPTRGPRRRSSSPEWAPVRAHLHNYSLVVDGLVYCVFGLHPGKKNRKRKAAVRGGLGEELWLSEVWVDDFCEEMNLWLQATEYFHSREKICHP